MMGLIYIPVQNPMNFGYIYDFERYSLLYSVLNLILNGKLFGLLCLETVKNCATFSCFLKALEK